jgi:hypothetical protein
MSVGKNIIGSSYEYQLEAQVSTDRCLAKDLGQTAQDCYFAGMEKIIADLIDEHDDESAACLFDVYALASLGLAAVKREIAKLDNADSN